MIGSISIVLVPYVLEVDVTRLSMTLSIEIGTMCGSLDHL